MIERLRELLDRPFARSERRGLFTLAASVLILAALGLALIGRPGAQHPGPAPRPTPVLPGPRPAPSLAPESPAPAQAARAQAAAQRFLDGYLAYLYGHGPARAIKGASLELRRRLEAQRPRVSPATRRRRGRVVDLSVRPLSGGRFAATVMIDDGGVARYPISLTLQRRGRGLRVVEVGGE